MAELTDKEIEALTEHDLAEYADLLNRQISKQSSLGETRGFKPSIEKNLDKMLLAEEEELKFNEEEEMHFLDNR